jgi:hypothetical protein
MPSTTVPGFLVDAYGRPVSVPGYGGAAGNLHRRTADDDRLRPRPPSHFADYIELLAPNRWRELVSESRALGARGQPASLLDQKSDYVSASHFRPQFKGTDADYGTAALPILEDALKICNLRGPLYDWKTTWRLTIPSLATDGSVYVLLTEWGETGWPGIQILEAHRIGQRNSSQTIIGASDAVTTITDAEGNNPKEVRGAYKGLRISSGHIYNREGTEVAYRVLGATPEEDRDISARDLFRVARPRSYSEGRTPPELSAAALDFLALDLAQTCALDSQIGDAKLHLIETTPTGRRNAADEIVNPSPGDRTPAGTPTTIEERATTRIIKSGQSLTPHASTRPSDEWMNFDSRVHSRGATGLRWRAEMLDPTALKGSATRAFQDQINTLIQETFGTIDMAATRVERYVAAKLAGPRQKRLPLHPETRMWGIATPPWFEVDRASAKYDLDDVAAGRVSMSTLHARDGKTSIEVYTERARAYQEALKVRSK